MKHQIKHLRIQSSQKIICQVDIKTLQHKKSNKNACMFYNFLLLLVLCFESHSYNSLTQLKRDMQNRVTRIARAAESIFQHKCEVQQFDCPVKSFNICEGTGVRECLNHYPTSTECDGLSRYSMTSGIRIPNSFASFDLTDQTKYFLCSTAKPQFQNTLKSLIQQNQNNYAWLSFGSSQGSHRVSPGFKYEKQSTTESCKNYDPRLRPWYASNVYNRKKLIILVQNSKRIHELPNRYLSIQISVKALLKTAEVGDYFNIIQFSDTARLLINPKEAKLVSVKQQIQRYDNATKTEGGYYDAMANNITKSPSSQVNYLAALQLATEVLFNSKWENPDYENLVLMFSGFQPTSYKTNATTGRSDFHQYLIQRQQEFRKNITFFGFGVDMVNDRARELMKSLTCEFDGVFFDLSDVKYESIFLDQARGFYEYLSQGNELQGPRWTNFYEDAFGLGRMTTVVRAAYYKQSNVTRLIGLAGIDVLVSQLTVYMSQSQIKQKLQVTQKQFKRNFTLCALEIIRRKHRCLAPEKSGCDNYTYCQPKPTPLNETVIRSPQDVSNVSCCPFEKASNTGLIVGAVIGGTVILIIIVVLLWCLICRKGDSSELEHTYIEIFQKFKDFDQTRIRRDSQTSLIKE